MSITTAQVIINDIEGTLQDESNEFWSADEHLQSINDGAKEIVTIKPDAYIKTSSVTLESGINQSIPSGGIQLIDITHNMGASPGTTLGASIRLVTRKVMDSIDPDWRSATGAAVVEYYMYDLRNPLNFQVSPPQPASGFGYVNMIYSNTPTEIAIGDTILVADIYRTALFYYGLSRAYLKTSEVAASAEKAVAYYNAFLNVLGIRQQAETLDDPNKVT